jgi:ornithine cyclodeaminase/alanine dehydrogenase-like protein (mu-crystallin family)
VLFLDGAAIRRCLDPLAAMQAVEDALAIQESENFTMPERMAMPCGGESKQLLLMPCRTDDALATKLVSVFPGNRAHGKPAINGIVVLNDVQTGEVLALLEGSTLTAMRTGAVSGVSVRHLAPEGADTLGIIGCGVQAYDQVLHACAARPLTRVFLYSRSASSCEALAARLAEQLTEVELIVAGSLEQLLSQSQIILTATTAREPVLPNEPAIFEGKHCIAIGSFEPEVREYPDAIFTRAEQVWVDTPHAVAESGELAIPLLRRILQPHQIHTLGAQIASGSAPDRGRYGTTFFKSVGMALFDLQTARSVYECAKRNDEGILLGT